MTSGGFTMVGLPTVTATIVETGLYGEIAARLWDVLPSGEQRLISRGVYRLDEGQNGQITFQLHGNGYHFAAGDTVQAAAAGTRRSLLPGEQRPVLDRSQQRDSHTADGLRCFGCG